MFRLNAKRKRTVWLVTVLILGISLTSFLVLTAMRENIMFFMGPAEVTAGNAPVNRTFRLGGLVAKNSVARDDGSLTVRFAITDLRFSVPVIYDGILPDLFREGESVVAIGTLNDSDVFVATTVLAKHDEKYMPREVKMLIDQQADSLPEKRASYD